MSAAFPTSSSHITLAPVVPTRVNSGLQYLAGQVARGSELHLLMKGTRSVTGTCGLENNMHFPKGQFDNGRELENGLCHYEMDETNDEMRLSNN